MPNIPITASRISSFYRMIEQMHNDYFCAHMTEEEKIAAEESFKGYFLPENLYMILQCRARHNPLFLQRTLKYKTEAKHQRRIQITLFLPGSKDAAGVETQKLFPLIVTMARLVSSKTTAESSAVYKVSRSCVIAGDDGLTKPQAKFILPRMDKLALDAKSGSLAILFVSFAGAHNYQIGVDPSEIPSDNIGGLCLWSKITVESLYSSWKENPNMDLGEKATSVSLVEMQPCFLLQKSTGKKFLEIQVPSNPLTSSTPQQVQVTISAQEVGATENPPYRSLFSFSDIPASVVVLGFPIASLRKGQVAFNYRYYYNKLQKTEVTEDFTCPCCKVKCASPKGLECHMSTHDLFNFEFWLNRQCPAIDLSLKSETMTTENNKGNPDARLELYPSSLKKSRRRKQKNPVRYLRPGPTKADEDNYVKSEKSQIPPGGAESSSQLVPPQTPADFEMKNMWSAFAKEHRSKKSRRRKQKTPVRNPMPGPLKITDDADSVKSEKSQIPPGGAESSIQLDPPKSPVEVQIMQMWKSFVEEHRVFADDRIAWGCEEFSKRYGPLLIKNPDLRWAWTKYIWTLKIYSRIDAQTVKNCTAFIEPLAK